MTTAKYLKTSAGLWLAVLLAMAVTTGGCGTDVKPDVGCVNDKQCGSANHVCQNKVCVSILDFGCTTNENCSEALAGGVWRKNTVLTACQSAKCVEKLCKVVNADTGNLCDDGDALSCTSGECDPIGQCSKPLKPLVDKGTCLIDGQCYAKSEADKSDKPDALCHLCNPDQTQTAWSNHPAGTACQSDNVDCTPDVCSASGTCTHAVLAGVCYIEGKCIKFGDLKPTKVGEPKEPCTGCDPAQNQKDWSPMPATFGCPDDNKECTQDLCDGKGACAHPNAAKGISCKEDDKLGCTIEECDGAGACGHSKITNDFCHIDSKCIASGTVHPTKPCQKCDPAANQNDWSSALAGSACVGDNLDCTEQTCDGKGSCADAKVKAGHCLIDSKGTPTCFGDGAPIDPAVPCVVCDSGNSKIGPTTVADNSACAAGAPCLAGKCEKGVCQNKGPKPNTCYIAADSVCADNGTTASGNPCLACQVFLSQTIWTALPQGATCTSDGVQCTLDACDGESTCLHLPQHGDCKDKAKACALGVCDAKNSCVAVPKDVTATCEGADGIACTVENCDGKGSCNLAGAATNSLCDDKVACTVDVCDGKLGCVFKPEASKCSDGNECTQDLCAANSGCKNPALNDGIGCGDDGLACTVNECKAGACAALPVESWCIIDNKCVAGSTAINGGCKFCMPSFKAGDGGNTYKWTEFSPGANCEDDKVECTADKCDGDKMCQHTPVASECDDGLPCTVNDCDAKAGCVFTDGCAWGHECDKAEKVCLTTGKAPLEIVKADAIVNPAPTNPALAVHDIAPGGKTGQRLWVLWQSDAVAQAEGGAWVIKNPKPGQGVGLFALPLDPQKAAVGSKVKPEAVALPVAGYFGGSKTVVQGFPVVAQDPLVETQAWLGWLEADPGNGDAAKQCLSAGGQGGVLRVARLHGGTKVGQVEVGGEVCAKAAGTNGPLFLTQGFQVLDGTGGDLTAASKRGILTLRPQGSSLAEWTGKVILKGANVNDAAAGAGFGPGIDFAKAHPVLVDFGVKAVASARYLGLAVTNDTGAFGLWGNYVNASGAKGAGATWTADKAVTDVFSGVTDVCGLDAAVDSAGNLGVVVVGRDLTSDVVLLLHRDATGTMTTKPIVTQPAIGKCRLGATAGRLSPAATGWHVTWLNSDTTETIGKPETLLVSGAQVSVIWKKTGFFVPPSDTTLATAGPDASLAWRGLTAPVLFEGRATQVFESTVAGDSVRAIRLVRF